MERGKSQPRRCAIYTRKSSEEGLEQDFNSLHAQREACEAFIKSQHGEGWRLVKAAYDDGEDDSEMKEIWGRNMVPVIERWERYISAAGNKLEPEATEEHKLKVRDVLEDREAQGLIHGGTITQIPECLRGERRSRTSRCYAVQELGSEVSHVRNILTYF